MEDSTAFWLPILETVCNAGFFSLSLEDTVLAQHKLCTGVLIEVMLLCQLRFLHSILTTQQAKRLPGGCF
jgi:hypothetical protein